MLYDLYRAHSALFAPARKASALLSGAVDAAPGVLRKAPLVRQLGALGDVIAGAQLTHIRPPFGIDSVEVDGKRTAVSEVVLADTPFAALVHFQLQGVSHRRRVLLVTPLSGHYSTMLTATIRTLLTDHDVYVTDWHNARDIPLSAGKFGMDEYVQHIIDFVHHLGPGLHVMAVCQPCVPAVVATSILAQDDDPDQPLSLTLMSGPIDARVNPTKINGMADKRDISWYRKNCITRVPGKYAGGGRRVYPGFLQIGAFMSMNLRRHVDSQRGIYQNLVAGDLEKASTTKDFYREYFAVLDIPEEFYLDSIQMVFKDHLLPRGEMRFTGRLVDPAAVKRTALLTIEAERDDMCAPGQTEAAHTVLSGLSTGQRRRHLQAGVGHYGIFAGRRWQSEVYPVIRDFIAEHENTVDSERGHAIAGS